VFKFSRHADWMQRLALFPLVLLCLAAAATLVPPALAIFTAKPAAVKSPITTVSFPPGTDAATQAKAQDDRIAAELKASKDQIAEDLATLKERASTQQSLITALTTLTGLYVVVLSLAAYARLQQTREESKDSVAETKTRMDEFIQEVRTDIPALHGIGRRIESLLAELDARLPVDGDWTAAETFRKLDDDQIQQALIDEMVINSLDIFNVSQDISNRRTVSRLFVRLGQFYFSKGSYLRKLEQARLAAAPPARVAAESPNDAFACLRRARLYFDKALEVDPTDPIALRARGVVTQHCAVWKKVDTGAAAYDNGMLTESRVFLARSIAADPFEPGALFANAWLLANSVPPDCQGAVESLTVIIDRATALPIKQRRKYVHSAYLNRANYRARLLAAAGHHAQKAESEAIAADIKDGKEWAVRAERTETYIQDVRAEIVPTGDLHYAYVNARAVRSAIDKL